MKHLPEESNMDKIEPLALVISMLASLANMAEALGLPATADELRSVGSINARLTES